MYNKTEYVYNLLQITFARVKLRDIFLKIDLDLVKNNYQ